MQNLNEQRYFLFDVPSGVSDDILKKNLAESAKCKVTGIEHVNWCKAVVNEKVGGVVRLQLDKEAAQILGDRRDYLFVAKQRVKFIDLKELQEIKAASSIDDDVLELAKFRLSVDGTGRTWKSIVGNLKMWKIEHVNGYYVWRIDGLFSDIIKFETKICDILFGEKKPNPPPLPVWPTKKESKKKRQSRAMRPIGERSSDESPSAIRSGDLSDEDLDDGEGAPSCVLTATTTTLGEISALNMLSTGNKSVFVLASCRVELYVNDLTKEVDVQAIVNPTDMYFNADANILSQSISAAVGKDNYERIRKSELNEKDHMVPSSAAITTAGNMKVKNIIHVAMPLNMTDLNKAVRDIGACYTSCLNVASKNKIQTISFPPLGIESGVNVETAAGGATAAILEAMSDSRCPLTDFDMIRFIFKEEKTKKRFLEIFKSPFQTVAAAEKD